MKAYHQQEQQQHQQHHDALGFQYHQQQQQQRRRAKSNYQTLQDEAHARVERNSSRGLTTATLEGIFLTLQKKFGFQEGNVLNQKEHLECWITNYETRRCSGNRMDPEEAIFQIHMKFFKNYTKWCHFLQTKPYLLDAASSFGGRGTTATMQVALYLLIWGESANLRFMPECLCFLYHSLASKLDGIEKLPNVAEGNFLKRVVRPIYEIIARMRSAPAGGKQALDHKNIMNYDDVNEFFWSTHCLDFDELNVAEAISLQEHKTFKERRSIFNPFLAFFRIYFFLIVSFHLLTIIAYVAYRTDPELMTGFNFYANFLSSDHVDMRRHAFYSIFLSICGLLAVKVVLEVWIGGIRIFQNLFYAIALFGRLCWHTIFLGLFIALNVSPYEKMLGDSSSFLDMGMVFAIIYLIPICISSLLQMTCQKMIWNISFFNALDGKKEQYIGRNMQQPWSDFLKYGAFWSLIFAAKLIFNLQLMIKPLVGPSVEIYDIRVSGRQISSGIVESDHNIAFLIAMWAPVFLVYVYDSQIWLAILQSIVGAFIGIRLKIGYSSRIVEFVDRLRAAPHLFDEKVVSKLAKGSGSLEKHDNHVSVSDGNLANLPEANSRLRFAVVWNEIVSSFRLNDLLDDRETAILQYQISDSGIVEDPVFLLAGRAQKATQLAAKYGGKRGNAAKVKHQLEKADVWGCTQNCIDIGYHVFQHLLGKEDAGILEVFDELLRSPTAAGCLNLTHLPLVRENIVDLLASLLDLPEPTMIPDSSHGNNSISGLDMSSFGIQHDQAVVVVQRVDALLKSLELLIEDGRMVEKIRRSKFANITPDLTYQKRQLMSLFTDPHTIASPNGHSPRKASLLANENVMTLVTRLFFLLTLDAADSLPRCREAQRRMSFFLNSLNMRMPSVESIGSMASFSVITPYYNESVLYSIDELNGRVNSNPLFRKVEQKDRDLSILKYLITFHSDEWGNFLERVGVTSIDEALAETPTQVRLWASMRGQTLARTVHGMMMYEDALKMLRWLEIGSDQQLSHLEKIKQMDRIAGLKFSYVTSCQIYSQQLAANDSRAADIDLLMRKYPNWRVSYVDSVEQQNGTKRYDCVLIKSDGDEIVEVYRYELPGNPLVGEGKPENQNIALPFTRGEYVQTIDMNQEHYFEEALKIPNFLATGTQNGRNVTIIGMKEHIFTGRASSLASFMTLQELVFVSLTQRVLANPMQSRMHYGHPDVFEKSFVMTNGGVSKASKGINLSEDVFSGYNVALRGEKVTHEEFMQCGKGRDVTLSQINAFEAKLSNGSAESSLSREAHRMGANMDFFRLNSMFYGHMGFYICNALTVLCVFVYAYSKLYIALHQEIQMAAITKTKGLDDLAEVLNTQFIFQFGMLMTIPLMATLLVELGWRQAIFLFLELILTLGPVFYIFETGTKSHFFDVAIMRGGSKYRGTGRGFAIIRETLVNFFKEYAASHYRKAVELLGLMILYGLYGNFNIGTNALEEYCKQKDIDCDANPDLVPQNITLLQSYGSKGQDYGVASFAVWLLGTCWLLAPFFFNTDGFDFAKTRVDVIHWLKWMMTSGSKSNSDRIELSNSGHHDDPRQHRGVDSWNEFWDYEADLQKDIRWTARVAYAIRELRHPLAMYYVYIVYFNLSDFALLGAIVGGVTVALWLGGFAGQLMFGGKLRLVRGILYMIIIIGGIVAAPLIIGMLNGWENLKSFSLMFGIFIGLYTLLQYGLILHGIMNVPLGKWGIIRELGFLFDMIVGLFLILPLLILSALPFMRTLQTRMMYNGGFSRALSTGNEMAASLSVLIGLLGGFAFGWLYCLIFSLGYVNDFEDHFINQSFLYFVNTQLDTDFPTEMLKVFCALAGVTGVAGSSFFGHFFGRRFGMALGCILPLAGVALIFITNSLMIVLGCCLIIGGIAMLSVSSMLYNYEICPIGWRGKGVLMFMVGLMLGYFVEALVLNELNAITMKKNWTNKPTHDWQYHFLYGAIPLLPLLGLIFFLPETPIWLRRHHKDPKKSEMTLARLRQKHDVNDELDDMTKAFDEQISINLFFRFAFVSILQMAFAIFMSSSLLLRVKVQTGPTFPGEQTSKWMVYFGLMNLIGVVLSIMTVDNVRRKTILKDVLPFCGAVAVACGILGVTNNQDNTLTQIALMALFVGGGLSLTCSAWLTAIEVFPPYRRDRFVAWSFGVFYLVLAVIYLIKPSFGIIHSIFAALCFILTGILFVMCASTPDGAIELKKEKKERKKREEYLEEVTSYVARVSRSQSFLKSRVRRSSSRYVTRTPREGAYEDFESPAANETTIRRPPSTKANGISRPHEVELSR